jgi:hypothetical protein
MLPASASTPMGASAVACGDCSLPLTSGRSAEKGSTGVRRSDFMRREEAKNLVTSNIGCSPRRFLLSLSVRLPLSDDFLIRISIGRFLVTVTGCSVTRRPVREMPKMFAVYAISGCSFGGESTSSCIEASRLVSESVPHASEKSCVRMMISGLILDSRESRAPASVYESRLCLLRALRP